MPLISVIIPAYNRAHCIQRALDSVVAQAISDIEIIVVDDASTDDTVAVVESYPDDRIRLFRHEQNRYAAAARNTGIAAATGEYIAFLDSDDAWLPQKLALQMDRLAGADQDCGCSYTGAIINMQGGLSSQKNYVPHFGGDVLSDYLACKFTIWTPTFLFRRALLEQVQPFDTTLTRGEDVDFYIRLLQVTRLSCVSEPAVELFLDLGKEIAEVSEACDRELLEKHAGLIQAQGPFRARYIQAYYEWRIGDRYLAEGRITKGLGAVLRALFTNPFLPLKRYAATLVRLMRALTSKRQPAAF